MDDTQYDPPSARPLATASGNELVLPVDTSGLERAVGAACAEIDRLRTELAELTLPVAGCVQEALIHPAHQVYFRAGLLACREYMARFVEAQDPAVAASIRANWWPSLGQDFGPPRQLDWSEVTAGEFGTPEFRSRTADELTPTQEALPIALAFLRGAVAPDPRPRSAARSVTDQPRARALLQTWLAEDAASPEVGDPVRDLAARIIDAIPGALGMRPDPWPVDGPGYDGEPHRTVESLIRQALSRACPPEKGQ